MYAILKLTICAYFIQFRKDLMTKRKCYAKTGAYLRACRKAKGIKQLTLAEKLGEKHYTIISQFETGHLKVPARLFVKYAEALDVELFEFIRNMLMEYHPELFEILIMKLYVQPRAAKVE